MVNPLARTAMQNVIDRERKGESLGSRSREEFQTFDDLIGDEGDEKSSRFTGGEKLSKKQEARSQSIKTIKFSNLVEGSKSSPEVLDRGSLDSGQERKRQVVKKKALDDLAREIKEGTSSDQDRPEGKGQEKRLKIDDLLTGDKRNLKRESESQRVGSYVDSRDRKMISDIIDGTTSIDEGSSKSKNQVKASQILNLSQAVSNLIGG